MQAEDIIQQKEWHQLTDAERKTVGALAATEGEYNVLKKMLLIAREDADDVPVVSPVIQNNLHDLLRKPSQKRKMTFWYAAAASVIAIVFTTLLLLQPKKHEPISVTTKDSIPKKIEVDTAEKKPLPTPLPVNESTEVVKKNQGTRITDDTTGKTIYKINRDSLTSLPDVAQINTSVNANTNLLSFVTEVY